MPLLFLCILVEDRMSQFRYATNGLLVQHRNRQFTLCKALNSAETYVILTPVADCRSEYHICHLSAECLSYMQQGFAGCCACDNIPVESHTSRFWSLLVSCPAVLHSFAVPSSHQAPKLSMQIESFPQ